MISVFFKSFSKQCQLITCFLLLIPSITCSQGHLLKLDESAIRLLTSYSKGSDFSGFAIGADYNYNGIVSLGILTYNGSYDDGNSTYNATGLFLGAYPIKASEDSPVSIQFRAGFYGNSYDDEAQDTLYLEFRQTQFAIDGGVNYHFFVGDKFLIVPGFSYTYTIYYTNAVNIYGRELEGKLRYSDLNLSTDFAFLVSHKILLSLIPELIFGLDGEDNSDVSFSVDFNFNVIL